VRNPWDRLLSCYINKIGDSSIHGNFIKYGLFYPKMSFEDFLKAVSIIPDAIADEHFKSQASFLWDKDGNQLVDFIGKLESLESDFHYVSKKHNFNVNVLPHLKKSKERNHNYQRHYTDETKKLVTKRYEKDIRLLGYSF
jgi:hypothetical protein